jgi:hypothetical protein
LAELLLVGVEGEGFVGADDDEEIVALREVLLGEAEGFAQAALDEVSLDGVAAAAADRDADAGREVVLAAEGAGHEGVADAAFALGEELVEAGFSAEAAGAREGVGGGGRGVWGAVGRGGHGGILQKKATRRDRVAFGLKVGRVRAGGC